MPNSSTVDERIVEMRIDNEKFEAGAKKTLNILEQLDKGLQGLGKQHADGFDDISHSLDKVTDRFSAMGIVGDQVIRTLTNKAMELVGQLKNVATALTTDQIDAGWDKYADKTKAIQTIMSATSGKINDGTFADQAEQLEWVNSQIEKLNWFTDETSYNFLDMVGNIGKFTAAGRELEESVTAMEGIATWAGISGATVPEASRAMYNLSQALGMGAVTQIDWKSIENANMATYEFKQQVIETAEELGSLVKIEEGVWKTAEGHEVTVESFRENLKDRWFNSDVLLDVLNRYGGFADELGIATDELDMTASEFLKAMKKYEEGGIEGLRSSRYTEDKIQAMLPYLEELTKAEWDLGRRAFQAAQEAKTFTEAIDATKDAVSTKWMDVFEIIFGDYLQAKELWTTMAETLWDMFAGPIDRLKEILNFAFNTPVQASEEIAGSMQEAVFSTESFEKRLGNMGKTMEDFGKAVREVADEDTKKLLDSYESIEDALKDNVISAELFKKAIGLLDTSSVKGKMSVNRALARAGKSMGDFEKAIRSVADQATLDLIEQFGGLDEALQRNAISADIFRAALAMLGIDSTNVAENVDEAVKSSGHSLDELREIALQTLRGDFGNGQERIDILEEMGYDAELIQGLAGILHDAHQRFGSYEMSDDWLMQQMAIYYRAQNLAAKTGYETFEEYVASLQDEVDAIDEAEAILHDADAILADMFGSGIFGPDGEVMTAGELFRQGLMNIMEFFSTVAEAIDTAFIKIFGGSDEAQDAIESVGSRFQAAALNFFSFTEKLKVFNKDFKQTDETVGEETGFDKLVNVFIKLFSVIQLVGKAISFVWGIVKTAVGFALRLLSPILSLVGMILGGVSSIGEKVSESFNGGFLSTLQRIGDTILNYVLPPIEKVISAIQLCADNFAIGFNSGGLKRGFAYLDKSIEVLLRDHPLLLTIYTALSAVFRAVGTAISFVVDHASILGDALLIVGTLIVAAFQGVIDIFGTVFKSIGNGATQLWEMVSSSEALSKVTGFLTNKFKGFGSKLKSIAEYIKMSYELNGMKGAIDGLIYSIKSFLPKSEGILNFFSNLSEAIRNGLSGIGNFFKELWAGIGKAKVDDGAVENTSKQFTGIFNTVLEAFFGDEAQRDKTKERVKQFVKDIWEGFLAGLREIRLRDVIAALRLATFASLVAEVVSAISVFKKIGEAVNNIPNNFNKLLERAGETMRALALSFQANTVLKLAVAIGILALAFLAFKNIPEDQLTHIAAIISGLMLIMILLVKMLQKTKVAEKGIGNVNIKNFQIIPEIAGVLFGFASLAVAIGIAVGALALIGKYGGKIIAASLIVGGILVAIGVLAALLIRTLKDKDITPRRIDAIGDVMMKIGVAFALVALAIQMLVAPLLTITLAIHFTQDGSVGWAFLAIIGFMIALGAFVGIMLAILKSLTPSKLEVIGDQLLKVTASLLIVAFAVQMLAVPVLAFTIAAKFAGNTALWSAVGAVVALLVVLLGMMALLIELITKKGMGEKKIEALGKTMLQIGASILLIALAVTIMSGPLLKIAIISKMLQSLDILWALLYIAGMLVVLGGVLLAMDKLKVNGGNAIKIAAAMLILAIAALVFAPAMMLMIVVVQALAAIIPLIDDFWMTMLKMGVLAVVLVIFAVAAVIFAAAILVIAAAFLVAAVGVLVFSVGLIALTFAMGMLVDTLPDFLEMMTQVGEQFSHWEGGWKQLLIGVGVLAALAVIAVLAARGLAALLSITGLGDKLKALGDSLVAFAERVTKGLFGKLGGLFTSLGKYLQNNSKAVLNILKGILVVIGLYITGLMPTLVDTIVKAIIDLINSVANTLRNNTGALLHAITNLLEAILEVFLSAIGWALGVVASLITDAMFGMIKNTVLNIERIPGAKALLRSMGLDSDSIDEAANNAKEGVTSAINEMIGDVVDYTREHFIAPDVEYVPNTEIDEEEIEEKTAEAWEDIAEAAESLTPPAVTVAPETELDEQQAEEDWDRLMAEYDAAGEAAAEDSDFSMDWSSMMPSFGDGGDEAASAWTDSFASKFTSFFSGGEGGQGGFMSSFDMSSIMPKFNASGDEAGNEFNTGFGNKVKSFFGGTGEGDESSSLVSMLSGSGKSMGGIFDGFLTKMNGIGTDGASELTSGLTSDTEGAAAAGQTLMSNVESPFASIGEDFKSFGANAWKALVSSVGEGNDDAYNAGWNLGVSLENGYTDATKTESPSRVFMELAEYVPQGLAMGLERGQGEAITSIVILSDAMIEAMQSAMARVAMVADEDFDISPQITPVVDLSNVNSAAGAMGGVFGRGYSVSAQMAGSVNKRLSDLERLSASMSNAGQTINNGDNITFNIYAAEGMSEEAIADAVMNRMATRMTRRGVAF